MHDIQELQDNALEAERYLKVLANKNRLMILCTLMESELSVGELNQTIPLSQSALSQHLGRMRELGFVSTRKAGQVVFYRVSDDKVRQLLAAFYEVFCGEKASV